MVNYSTNAAVKVGEDIYFSNYQCNGLYKYNMKNKKFEFVCFFSNVNIMQQGIHSEAIYNKGVIYFLPYCSNTINCYEIKNNREYSFVIENNKKREAYYSGAYFENEKIHIFPCYSGDTYVEFDYENKKVIYNEKITKIVEKNVEENSQLRMKKYKKKLYFCAVGNKDIYVYENEQTDVLHFDDDMYDFFVDDDGYWMTFSDRSNIVKYDKDFQKTIYGLKNSSSQNCNSIPYSNMIFFDNDIMVLNQYADHIMQINKGKKQIEIAFPDLAESCGKNDLLYGPYYKNCIVTEEELIFFPLRANRIIVYDRRTQETVDVDTFADNFMIPNLDVAEKKELLVSENRSNLSLDNFLTYMV